MPVRINDYISITMVQLMRLLAPWSQKWPLGHRRGTMPRCATATVPTASHTSQAPISTTQDANSASAALHAPPCAALRPRSSLSTYIFSRYTAIVSDAWCVDHGVDMVLSQEVREYWTLTMRYIPKPSIHYPPDGPGEGAWSRKPSKSDCVHRSAADRVALRS